MFVYMSDKCQEIYCGYIYIYIIELIYIKYRFIYIYICMTTSGSLMSGYVSVQLHVQMADTCQSQYKTHIMQYTIYIYTIYNIYTQYIYIYMYIHQYLLQFTSICPWACEYMCPSVFHNFVRKKNESTGSHVIKNRAHNMSSAGALDLTWPVFIPELEMVKTIPKW